ncbi:copper resistance system multicopper oxidase, partial [Erythrobacter sp.]|uniref:copper resistance system multicopper oxidase n=1 Tax=Erythrobacter sp. TaxID=1042 RepID=UPI002E9B80D4|nr:copper resistance system multicopper oxidase [Erythrobacter sp.]
PLIRLREGQDIRLHVTNNLDEDSSIHWHGLLLPFQFDGVPGVSFPGIKPGETFTYEFPVRQNGTYWWHSHSGLQEQAGHYGPIIVESNEPDPRYDRDYVILLSEFTPIHPHQVMRKLKVGEHYFNRQMQSVADGDMPGDMRRMWSQMRMNPRDISDVTGSTYTYLINGYGPADDLQLEFRPGERVRLRVINGSAMSFFNFRIPGVPMTVIQADGQDVDEVEVDEFQIGVAETYDVIVAPTDGSHAIVAEAMDRSGMGVASLTSHKGHIATPPALREPVTLSMTDMGMMDHSAHAAMGHDMGEMDGMDHDMRDTSKLPADVKVGPGIDMVAPSPVDRMDFPGLGLDKVPHRVLRYTDLRAKRMNPHREVEREMEIHLTGNMERYMWSFDGKKFTSVTDDPIRFAFDERVRVKLVNQTMMAHPIHLHGHFFEMVNGADRMHQPVKHTMVVQPGGTATFDVTANEPGDWAFHCHLLYHMHAGMMQVVTVRPFPDGSLS